MARNVLLSSYLINNYLNIETNQHTKYFTSRNQNMSHSSDKHIKPKQNKIKLIFLSANCHLFFLKSHCPPLISLFPHLIFIQKKKKKPHLYITTQKPIKSKIVTHISFILS